MQKNEFEKQVQQKMEELKLQPSDSVWLNIESRISRNKRRRFGWVFFSILLIGLVGGFWLWDSMMKPTQNQKDELSKNFVTKKDSLNDQHRPSKNFITEKDSLPGIDGTVQSAKNIVALNQTKKIFSQSFQKKSESKSLSKRLNQESVATKLPVKNEQQNISAKLKVNTNEALADLVENKNLIIKSSANPHEENKIISPPINEINKDSSLSAIIDSTDKIAEAKKLTTENIQTKKLKLNTTKGGWKWGLTFSAGITGIPNKFLGSLDKSYSADSYTAIPQTNPNQDPNPLPSKIKSSGALIAGFYVEKNISKNKIITIGLNYKTFSLTNKVGKKNDSGIYSLSNPINKYHNHFHFIELPVALKVQISSKGIPLFWDAGVSVSQLIGSNALQFNSTSAFYYHNNTLFNKSQIGFNTGFSASFFNKQKTSILFGPYIYYGPTKIAAEGLYQDQHFTFIGLRTQVLFKK